ncbi:glycosyltransferase family 2 protein [Fluviispira vulneris]|uniref:glycosyltransferase family 2 protein n=1 Tax=Fluviispira vulneris TaxID=2763012 RepID=UPI0016453442|nr:glycosyltransferase family 2 protein [Fluviispira vulneris]
MSTFNFTTLCTYKVSIIIPIYNDEVVIPRLVNETLINYKNENKYEIIIIDDFSVDNSLNLIKELLILNNFDNYIILKHSKNLGASAARNYGCRHANGEFIAFLDSDDSWHLQKLELQINIMMQQKSFLSGTLHKVIDPKNLKKSMNLEINNVNFCEIKWPNILFKSPFSTPSVVMHRSLLKNFKFDESFRYSEDYDLWLRISNSYKTVKILENLTFTFKHDYLSNNKSLSSNLLRMQNSLTFIKLKAIKDRNINLLRKIIVFISIFFDFLKLFRRIILMIGFKIKTIRFT